MALNPLTELMWLLVLTPLTPLILSMMFSEFWAYSTSAWQL
jgi:hypothetical protein